MASFFPAYLATAQEAWVARYNSSRNLDDGSYAVAVDAPGNVYVTGYSNGGGTGDDYATISETIRFTRVIRCASTGQVPSKSLQGLRAAV